MSQHRRARRFAKRAASSEGVGSILNPTSANRRRGTGKDHHRENLRRMRAKQRQNRETANQAATPSAAESFRLAEFQDVEPRVRVGRSSDDDKPKHSFLRRTSSKTGLSGRDSGGDKPRYVSRKKKTKPPVPKVAELEQSPAVQALKQKKQRKNYIRENLERAKKATPRVERDVGDEEEMHALGEVPEYLVERKHELEAKAEAARQREAAAQSSVPPGMVRMSEEERLRTLAVLRENREKLQDKYQRLPVIVETPSMIRRQEILIEKLKQVEEALELFQRDTVYIAATD